MGITRKGQHRFLPAPSWYEVLGYIIKRNMFYYLSCMFYGISRDHQEKELNQRCKYCCCCTVVVFSGSPPAVEPALC